MVVRYKVLRLYDGEGWIALGYANWRECVVAEFGQSERHLYRLLEAAQAEKNICPTGQIGSVPERHLRPLTDLEPEQQRAVWQAAVETAPEGKVTAKHVQADAYCKECKKRKQRKVLTATQLSFV